MGMCEMEDLTNDGVQRALARVSDHHIVVSIGGRALDHIRIFLTLEIGRRRIFLVSAPDPLC